MKDYTWLIILIAAAVGAVVFLIAKKIKKNKGSEITEFVEATREAFKEEMAESAPAKMSEPLNHNPSQSGSAKIFINGGRPAGALMGKLYVDGKLILGDVVLCAKRAKEQSEELLNQLLEYYDGNQKEIFNMQVFGRRLFPLFREWAM